MDSIGILQIQRRRSHRYRGHRADSFYPIDNAELVELRARQRTFNGAYARTALGNIGYSLTILKLFDRRFYKIGLLFAILALLLFILSFFRDRHSRHDFADPRDEQIEDDASAIRIDDAASSRDASPAHHTLLRRRWPWGKPSIPVEPIKSVGQSGRIFGRPFVTAGYQVLAVATVVFGAEVGLVVLILR
ncbi:hypothetical protein Moror_14539, partial [Moniliophthora roreri MCA 2997]